MNFSAFSIRNPIPAVLLFILLTLAGMSLAARKRTVPKPAAPEPVLETTLTPRRPRRDS